jgi:hypothetical protein
MKLRYKKYVSKYELQYIIWQGIDYDREKLIRFIKRYKWLRLFSFLPFYSNEYKFMYEILHTYNIEKLELLLNNDEHTSRMCLIEKYARQSSIELLLTNLYSKQTFETISNLPINDFKLVIKRTMELVKLGRDVTTQNDNITNDVPGI